MPCRQHWAAWASLQMWLVAAVALNALCLQPTSLQTAAVLDDLCQQRPFLQTAVVLDTLCLQRSVSAASAFAGFGRTSTACTVLKAVVRPLSLLCPLQ